MAQEKEPRIYVKGGWIPAFPGNVAIDDSIWKNIHFSSERLRERHRLSHETHSIAREIADKFLITIFDISSQGLAIKLGALFLLTEGSQLTEEEYMSLFTEKYKIGTSNITTNPLIQDIARGDRADWINPGWFFDHFAGKQNLIRAVQTGRSLAKHMEDIGETHKSNSDQTNYRKDFLPLAYEDLFWIYVVCAEVINYLNTKFPKLIRPHSRSQRYAHLRNQKFHNFLLFKGLKTKFGWPHDIQPTLKELLDASYQLLIEKRPLDFNEEMPAKLIF